MGDPETDSNADTSLTTSIEAEDSDGPTTSGGQSGKRGGRRPIPGAQARSHLGRKFKAEAGLCDRGLQAYMDQQSQQLQEIFKAEQEHRKSFEDLLRAIQDADERRYSAMQAQQQVQMQMFSQALSSIVNVLASGQPQHPPSQYPPSQHIPPTHWIPTAPMRSTPTSTWPTPHPPGPLPPHPMFLPPMKPSAGEESSDTPPLSHTLSQLNDSERFCDL